MNIYLNLLPEERKEKLKRKKLFWLIIRHELLLCFAGLVFLAILFSANFILNLQKKSLDNIYAMEISRKEYREIEKYEKAFEEENIKIDNFFMLQKKHLDWLNVLNELAKVFSDDIKLSEFVSEDIKISIAGKASTRESLLDLKNKIENSECFFETEIPLSDIVAKNNIDFEAEFKIEEKCIKTKNK
ncbi:MAG: hypothetical protein UR69_C0002G0095 [Candidatus Moranbacteria bacterium GW2011_GWE2_35_2-]|nr:MAG: hypothetical protein UR69_C0002G0095 [Candidatus Moranbacteria bacterium GW2011_GWE2_35_2-]KKQ05800.1 MAG: hypothetical protein US15_C0026G0007 [Candidatus Moranbacteria bacterium GW2011_GWF1_36_4]KKQ22556.1 MAG: hypothetical protein US37_C0002G0181 [Candidatus Moranbacteria bacterium GW2011_GWF2_37_11]KKQ28959.1 MAG: hypothetical protein US44_C0004G0003 [Candidatus Moranbacteria bacterium GW2011_GWD1_37_17]KKQ30505.1 MAG: hypothetical protein US47_C0002G0095 [Candidatus Moranbacteria b